MAALYTQDEGGSLLRVNEPGGAPAPRLFFGVTEEGVVWSVRADQSQETAAAIASLLQVMSPLDPRATELPAEVLDLIAGTGRIERVWRGPAYLVPPMEGVPGEVVKVGPENANVLEPYLAEWIPDAELGHPLFASLAEGRAVSLCCSVRVTPDAHEAGVETHPDFRGQGRAPAVVAAWAAAVRGLDATPLYSTWEKNTASIRVAEKLGLVWYGTDFHVS